MNKWYNLLSKNQRDNIYRNRRKQIGKYLALWSESKNSGKFMVTLSPIKNSLDATIALRRNFFKKLNSVKYYRGSKVAYFSAIEIGLNKNPPLKSAQITQETRMKLMQRNYHLHVQILTDDITKADLQTVLSRLDPNLCYFNYISEPKVDHIKYDYVIKDIKTIDWKLQYILKTQHKSKILYSSSKKQLAQYMITKIWDFMKINYADKWTKIVDKYSYILGLKDSGDLTFGNSSNISSLGIMYDEIHIKDKGIYIYIKKNIL